VIEEGIRFLAILEKELLDHHLIRGILKIVIDTEILFV